MALNSLQLVNLVLGRSGRRESDTYLQGQLLLELVLVQSRLEGGATLPWFLLTDEEEISTVLNTRSTALPDDYLRSWEYSRPARYVSDSSEDRYSELASGDYDELQAAYPLPASGPPEAYTISGSSFDWFPLPDDVYPVRWRYYAAQTALNGTDSLTNAWTQNAGDVLLAELGIVCAEQYLRNAQLAKSFQTELIRAQSRLLVFDEARKQAIKDGIRGD